MFSIGALGQWYHTARDEGLDLKTWTEEGVRGSQWLVALMGRQGVLPFSAVHAPGLLCSGSAASPGVAGHKAAARRWERGMSLGMVNGAQSADRGCPTCNSQFGHWSSVAAVLHARFRSMWASKGTNWQTSRRSVKNHVLTMRGKERQQELFLKRQANGPQDRVDLAVD